MARTSQPPAPFRRERYAGCATVAAMIGNLIQTLPKHRHLVLEEELGLLDRDIEKYFVQPVDLALARVADSLGSGGSSGKDAMR
jgi:hypothetical protein